MTVDFDARQSRAELREDLRAALLAAAARLISEEGLGALALRRLAERVNVSTKAVYTLFGGKEGLMEALYVHAFDGIASFEPEILNIASPQRRILELLRSYRRYALARPDLYAVMFGDAAMGLSPSAESRRHAWNTTRPMRQALRECRPGMTAEEADFIMRALWSAVHGIVSLELRQLIGGHDMATRLFDESFTGLLRHFGVPFDREMLKDPAFPPHPDPLPPRGGEGE